MANELDVSAIDRWDARVRVPRRADGVLDGLQHAAEGVLLSRGLRDTLVEAAGLPVQRGAGDLGCLHQAFTTRGGRGEGEVSRKILQK